MASHPWIELQKQFEKGSPLPAVDPADIKQLYVARLALEAERGPASPHAAIGFGALGIDVSSRGPEFETESFFITTRLDLLGTLVARGVLTDYQSGDDLDERVYLAAATVPFNYEEWGESMMALKIPDFPAGALAKVKQDFRDHGYDLDHPRIDAKFLAWLREHC